MAVSKLFALVVVIWLMCVCQTDVARVKRDVVRQKLKSQVLRLAAVTLHTFHNSFECPRDLLQLL